jgi:hypothetical protein
MKRVKLNSDDDLLVAAKFLCMDNSDQLVDFMQGIGKVNLERLAQRNHVDFKTCMLLRCENQRIKEGQIYPQLVEEIPLLLPTKVNGVWTIGKQILNGSIAFYHGVVISDTYPRSSLKQYTDQITGLPIKKGFRSLSFRHGDYAYGSGWKTTKGQAYFLRIKDEKRHHMKELNEFHGLVMEMAPYPRLLKSSKTHPSMEVTKRGTRIQWNPSYSTSQFIVQKKNNRYCYKLKEKRMGGVECIEYDEPGKRIIYWEYTKTHARKYVFDLLQVEKYLVRLALRESPISTDLYPKIISYLSNV